MLNTFKWFNLRVSLASFAYDRNFVLSICHRMHLHIGWYGCVIYRREKYKRKESELNAQTEMQRDRESSAELCQVLSSYFLFFCYSLLDLLRFTKCKCAQQHVLVKKKSEQRIGNKFEQKALAKCFPFKYEMLSLCCT